jgi:hypothetical protein
MSEKIIVELTPTYTKRDNKGFRFYSAEDGNKLYAEKNGDIYNVNEDTLKPTSIIPLQRSRFKFVGLIDDADVKDLHPLHYEREAIERTAKSMGMADGGQTINIGGIDYPLNRDGGLQVGDVFKTKDGETLTIVGVPLEREYYVKEGNKDRTFIYDSRDFWESIKSGEYVKHSSSKEYAKGGSVTMGQLEDIVERFNSEGSNFELRGAYGNLELWSNGRRLEVGSKKDIKEALIKYRFYSSKMAHGGETDEPMWIYEDEEYTDQELIDLADEMAEYDMQDTGEHIKITDVETAIDYLGDVRMIGSTRESDRFERDGDEGADLYDDDYADGGDIPNNYEDLSEEDVWDMWTNEQKTHFLSDHHDKFRRVKFFLEDSFDRPMTYRDVAKFYNFNELPYQVKDALREHIQEGQYAKGGNVPSIEKRVIEVNKLIEYANDKGLEVVDESTTWQAPMKFKPLKYSNGVLYVSLIELDLYKYNKGMGSEYKKESYKIGKNELGSSMRGNAQTEALTDIARMHRKAINSFEKYGYADGGKINDNYQGKSEQIKKDLRKIKSGVDNKPPVVFEKDGFIYVSAEENDGYADYYRYYINKDLIKVADKYGTFWEWEDAGSIMFAPEWNWEDKMAKGGINDYSIGKYWVDNEKTNFGYAVKTNRKDKGLATISYHKTKSEANRERDKLNANGSKMADGGRLDTKTKKEIYQEWLRFKNGLKGGSPHRHIKTWTELRGIELSDSEINDIIREGKTKYAEGGPTFDDKVDSISKALVDRKKVPKSVQKDYGKTYSKKEAIESAKRIAGAMRKKEMAKKKS